MLATRLYSFKDTQALVLAIPRGGVVVGYEIAKALGARLDVIVPRKIRAPHQEELAIGAVAAWGDHEAIVDDSTIRMLGVSYEYLTREVEYQLAEVNRRLLAYRGTTQPPDIEGKVTILVDDGVATGYTIRAAAVALRNLRAGKVIIAVPVGPPECIAALEQFADDVKCLATPDPFLAVGYWYRDFGQVSDEEVVALLRKAQGANG